MGEASQDTDFSSPYRVKVVKEFTKQRKEEVDLETGKRKSWVEVQEFEVFDLTGGDTPAKKVDPRKISNTEENLGNTEKVSTNTEDYQTKEVDTPPPRAPSALPFLQTDPNICPDCGRSFKGVKGVKSHRSRPTSACAVGKENREVGNTVNKERTNNVDTSVVVIQDTPEVRRTATRPPLGRRN